MVLKSIAVFAAGFISLTNALVEKEAKDQRLRRQKIELAWSLLFAFVIVLIWYVWRILRNRYRGPRGFVNVELTLDNIELQEIISSSEKQ